MDLKSFRQLFIIYVNTSREISVRTQTLGDKSANGGRMAPKGKIWVNLDFMKM